MPKSIKATQGIIQLILEKNINSEIQKLINLPQELHAPQTKGVVGEVIFRVQDKDITCELEIREDLEERSVLDIAKELL